MGRYRCSQEPYLDKITLTDGSYSPFRWTDQLAKREMPMLFVRGDGVILVRRLLDYAVRSWSQLTMHMYIGLACNESMRMHVDLTASCFVNCILSCILSLNGSMVESGPCDHRTNHRKDSLDMICFSLLDHIT